MSEEVVKRPTYDEVIQQAMDLAARAVPFNPDTGEVDEDALAKLEEEQLQGVEAVEDKIFRYLSYLHYSEQRRDSAEASFKRFKARHEREKKRCEFINERLKGLMKATSRLSGRTKVEVMDGSSVTLVTKRVVQVVVDDETLVPIDLMRVKYSVDKAAAKRAAEEGQESIPGISFVETESQFVRRNR